MGLIGSCAALAALLAPAALAISAICSRSLSGQAVVVAAIGGGVCWLAGALALGAAFVANRLNMPVQGVLLGMLFRMGLPLVALVALPALLAPWATEGLATTILGVYLVALAGETLLALRMVSRPAPAAKAV